MAASSKRPVNGILLLDKPEGLTSNRALQKVKRLFKAQKAGHTGSLDPLATGLLPLCFGEATKISGFLLDADKRYRFTCKLGETTTTGDQEGDVLERLPVPELTETVVETALARFRGEIEQIPPMYSALKHQGERLYRLARQGVEVERKARRVLIHELVLVRLGNSELELDVHCSKGTYVRSLCEDLGAALGCGAHVSQLRRTALGPFAGQPMITLDALEALAEQGLDALDNALLPIDAGLAHWPAVQLDSDSAYYLRQGQPVWVPKAPGEGSVRIYGPQDVFVGMGAILDDGRVAPKRLLAQA
ncbi:tRNA pseudouridine(55) synthase TruB [Alkalilimnicola ehrlichii]|uniref:tRNA pseudouridine synthase B n=1 Tax=Alkalilimnicola ehrlichii TaxID=351052 RepID=A0A3E0WYU7_9GAMM|nr:tRNA pseudouridine(55) synthase TruB [Alkalilimnicola ehrlichii]RFA30613.1 tRNA pseudouridine(55) synthase TruB [Alkalilimnicola ehrlichii]RFA38162.1 tRNA pseudouridine(55) synthase TruB [Alkalilimnicola ehrlichii]